jgi:hypothetical protein
MRSSLKTCALKKTLRSAMDAERFCLWMPKTLCEKAVPKMVSPQNVKNATVLIDNERR